MKVDYSKNGLDVLQIHFLFHSPQTTFREFSNCFSMKLERELQPFFSSTKKIII